MTGKPKKKWILKLFVFLLAIYFIWLGALLLRYREPRAELPRKEGPPFEIEGAYHIHTTFSDGHSTPEKIVAIASRKSMDFIILTDHGNPNLASLAAQGRKGKVLVLAGSELSVSRGHLVALGFDPPKAPFSQYSEQASQEVKVLGGFTIIAHPFSKVRWSWGEFAEYSGIEIVDSDSMIRRNFVSSLPYFPALLVKPGLYLLKTLARPGQSLRKWDELNKQHPWYGYFSVDAHVLYSALLSCFRLHILLPEPLSQDFETAKAQVFNALRQGRFYNGIDAARSARGFLFWAEKGQAKFPMGSTVSFDPETAVSLRVSALFPFKTETRFIYDGETILSSEEKRVSLAPQKPGIYRVEIYLKEWSPLARDIPWIVSNPIFLKEDEK
jgi:hypothetical protein